MNEIEFVEKIINMFDKTNKKIGIWIKDDFDKLKEDLRATVKKEVPKTSEVDEPAIKMGYDGVDTDGN